MGGTEVCTAHSATSGLRVPWDPGSMAKGWLNKGNCTIKLIKNVTIMNDLYNKLYICLFLCRFKNWGFKSFIRETKGPLSTSAS